MRDLQSLSLILTVWICGTHGYLHDPLLSEYLEDFQDRFAYRGGDLLLAGLFSLHTYDKDNLCGDEVFEPAVYHAASMIYAIDAINNDPRILPNVSLGYVIFDECRSATTAMLRMLHLLPDKPLSYQYSGTYSNSTFPTFDVVGVVGPATSSSAYLVSQLLNAISMPVVSFYATADRLSHKSMYPYFLRTIPPDLQQVRTMVSLLRHFNWTYLSAVFMDTFGKEAVTNVKNRASKYGICFARMEEISKATGDREYDGVIHRLKGSGARIVLLYVSVVEGKKFLRSFMRLEAYKDLIVIASDGMGGPTIRNSQVDNLPVGFMVTDPFMTNIPEFDAYFSKITSEDAERNVVFRDFWEKKLNCSFSDNSCHSLYPRNQKFTPEYGFQSEASVSLVVDAVYAFAHALDDVTRTKCGGKMGVALRKCFFGDDLMPRLKKTQFKGVGDKVRFDENGDFLGHYQVMVLQNNTGKNVASPMAYFDINNNTFIVNNDFIQWHPEFNHFDQSGVPKSVCSDPCDSGHYKYRTTECCWVCKRCRLNEITDPEQGRCMECPDKYWPDESDYLQCYAITPTYSRWDEAQGVSLAILSSVGLIVCFMATVAFVKFSDNKLIKASSVELMYVILSGLCLSLITVLILLAKPTDATCIASFFGFILSFTAVYAPLLTKTRRIFAIFDAGTKTTKEPPFISKASQLVITFCIVFAQVLIGVITSILVPPCAKTEMPDKTQEYVELGCQIPMEGLLSALAYIVLLVTACTYFAVKVRGVPDNFNESKFIGFNVYTTLVLFIAFIPTYLTTSSLLHRVLLLVLCLLVNTFVVIVCLFLPKLYAVCFIDVKKWKLTNQVSVASATKPPREEEDQLRTVTGMHI